MRSKTIAILLSVVLVGLSQAEEAAEIVPASKVSTQEVVVETPAPQAAQSTAPQVVQSNSKAFAGYDFEQVVQSVETSVNPLQQEMGTSMKVFAESVTQAQQLIEEGRSKEAIQLCATAMEEVLAGRDRVLAPMWEGQDYLNEQMAKVRGRLAQAVEASGGESKLELDKQTEGLLDSIAGRVAKEQDPIRKKRLVAHYKTVRQIAKIRLMAQQLSPNQRKLWRNVLAVLENTTMTHQQVLMGTEVLFAQCETISANLREYEGLIDTVEGASRLIGVVQGLGQSGQGLAQFSQTMMDLQTRMADFNGQIEGLLESKMIDLEAQSEAVVENMASSLGEDAVMGGIDDELASRLGRLGGE